MSIHYLGDQIDIHTGGVDHIPIHHENEIAQSDAYAGKSVVSIWMHNEFLLIDNGKMSKSLRNAYTVADIRARGYSPLAYRYFCLNGHYRNKLNFTWDGLKAASVSFRRFIEGAKAHKCAAYNDAAHQEPDSAAIKDDFLRSMAEAFDAAVYDDLNIPKALGIAWQLIRQPVKDSRIYDLLLSMDEVLGLGLAEACDEAPIGEAGEGSNTGPLGMPNPQPPACIPEEIATLISERDIARANKDWKRSDELRDEIKEKGYNLLDSKQGTKVERIISHN